MKKTAGELVNSDRDLLERIQLRDQQALQQLYDRYENALWKLISRCPVCIKTKERILKETFHQVWEGSPLASNMSPTTYLLQIVKERIRHYQRD
ncbi:hypothetical protein MKY84_00880 [Chryseomicrobium sp. FSL W7-1435]|uniref:RNA polymerase sigma factor n=1 Tax=Chryseomicrobium sp. FSL W7-1435 TaxID=2921704 RepID=UPI00315B119E